MRPLRLHPEANRELEAAAEFYEAQSPGLAGEFVREVEEAFSRIREGPLAGSPEEAGIRKRYLKRFPFTIVYETGLEAITVIAVAHQRRRPGYWRGRDTKAGS